MYAIVVIQYLANKELFLCMTPESVISLAVTETWLQHDETQLTQLIFHLMAIRFFYEIRADQRTGGGEGILVSDKFI